MKEKIIKSTIILLIGGFITKILGMIIKIVMARLIGAEGIGLYMLILPTFSLLISLSQFGLPLALSKLISEENKNNKNLFFSIIPIILIINLILMILIIILSPFISNNLLHNSNTFLAILSMSFVIPFTSISSICRSYFFGKQKMLPHVISNIVEDIVRLIIIIIGIPYILPLGLKYTVSFLVLSNVISEIVSTIILIIFIPKKITITKKDIIPNKKYIKESLKISIPNTASRLIGSIGYFFEPIILTTILLKIGYNSSYITKEYGIITGYVYPLILLPSFFTNAISQSIFPIISKEYANNNYKSINNKINIAILISLFIGITISIIIFLNPELLLKKIYNTNEGIDYIRFLVPICILHYIQSPLSTSLDAMRKTKINLIITIISTTIRTLLLFCLSYLKIGIWSLIYTTSINIIITTIILIIITKKELHF